MHHIGGNYFSYELAYTCWASQLATVIIVAVQLVFCWNCYVTFPQPKISTLYLVAQLATIGAYTSCQVAATDTWHCMSWLLLIIVDRMLVDDVIVVGMFSSKDVPAYTKYQESVDVVRENYNFFYTTSKEIREKLAILYIWYDCRYETWLFPGLSMVLGHTIVSSNNVEHFLQESFSVKEQLSSHGCQIKIQYFVQWVLTLTPCIVRWNI